MQKNTKETFRNLINITMIFQMNLEHDLYNRNARNRIINNTHDARKHLTSEVESQTIHASLNKTKQI